MARIYYQLILNGTKTLEDVPKRLQEEVKKLLEDNGYSTVD